MSESVLIALLTAIFTAICTVVPAWFKYKLATQQLKADMDMRIKQATEQAIAAHQDNVKRINMLETGALRIRAEVERLSDFGPIGEL